MLKYNQYTHNTILFHCHSEKEGRELVQIREGCLNFRNQQYKPNGPTE